MLMLEKHSIQKSISEEINITRLIPRRKVEFKSLESSRKLGGREAAPKESYDPADVLRAYLTAASTESFWQYLTYWVDSRV